MCGYLCMLHNTLYCWMFERLFDACALSCLTSLTVLSLSLSLGAFVSVASWCAYYLACVRSALSPLLRLNNEESNICSIGCYWIELRTFVRTLKHRMCRIAFRTFVRYKLQSYFIERLFVC